MLGTREDVLTGSQTALINIIFYSGDLFAKNSSFVDTLWAIWAWLGIYHLGRLKASESNWVNVNSNKIVR